MPTESTYPPIDIPDVDIWAYMFERKDREYPEDKGLSGPQTLQFLHSSQ